MITKRDMDVIEYIYSHPNCTTSEITHVFFDNDIVARRRLTSLVNAKKLTRARNAVSMEYKYKVTKGEKEAFKKYGIRIQNNFFTNEKDFQIFCSKNMECIEKGLYFLNMEVPIKNGFIDILALDKCGRICIIELKINNDSRDIIYQCTHYKNNIQGNPRVITITTGYAEGVLNALKKMDVETKIYIINENGNVEFKNI